MALTRPTHNQVNTSSTMFDDNILIVNAKDLRIVDTNGRPDLGIIFYRPNAPETTDVGLIWNEATGTFSLIHTDSIGSGPAGDVPILDYASLSVENCSVSGNINVNSSTSHGILFNNQFGWRDLIGNITPREIGGTAPTLRVFRGAIKEFAYAVGNSSDCTFHIPHDYAPGTDMYLHAHWSHNGTNISGTFQVDYNISYAKGHQQQTFSEPIATSCTVAGLNITNTPQYMHRVDEIQVSTAGGSTTMIDTNQIEVDGMILINFVVNTIPSITGGQSSPFMFTVDLHYQSTGINTLNKSPNFYG